MTSKRIQTDRESKVLFAMSPAHTQPDGVPVLVFVMPNKAWEYMKDGLGHDFDLTNVGIPLKILIGRCKDHADGMARLEQFNGGELKRSGFKDVRDVDVSFGDKPKQS